jgi:hypothetical protein
MSEYEDFLKLVESATKDGYMQMSWDMSNYLKDTNRTPEFLEKVLLLDLGGYSYAYYSAIADNPSTPQEVIDKLVKKARHRWEWRSLSGYYRRLAKKKGLSDEIKDYPVSLLDGRDLEEEERVLNLYCVSGYMIEDLWQDLAAKDILELVYYPDSYDGDSFGPQDIIQSATEYLLTPGFDCSWIDKNYSVDVGYIIDDAEEIWARYVDDEGSDDWAEDLMSDYSVSAVFATGVNCGDITQYNYDEAAEFLSNSFSDDEQYSEVSVTILELPYNGLRYQQLGEDAQLSLVNNITAVHEEDVFHNHFRLAEHLLSLIVIHPKTTARVLELIGAHTDENISKLLALKERVNSGEKI